MKRLILFLCTIISAINLYSMNSCMPIARKWQFSSVLYDQTNVSNFETSHKHQNCKNRSLIFCLGKGAKVQPVETVDNFYSYSSNSLSRGQVYRDDNYRELALCRNSNKIVPMRQDDEAMSVRIQKNYGEQFKGKTAKEFDILMMECVEQEKLKNWTK